ncbi:hypothetical protein [Ornithinimicrobium sp. LYQ103]|uniref:hypothetical protein n=1 Tax=Ornithinimicrobium sp. LYQ103 TaxID=3378796 RepID=UPI00385489F1
MTALQAESTTSAARDARPAQWVVMTRLLASDAMRGLLTATGVMLVVLAVGSLIARWQGWQLVSMTDTDMVGIEVVAGQDGVTLVASLFLVPMAVAIAAAVMAVVLAARTRVFLAAGATRRSVATGQLVVLVVMTLYVLAVTAAVLLVVGRGTDGALDLVGADGGAGAAVLVVRATGVVLGALTAGSLITALFLRWPWWVGVGALLLVLVVVPGVVEVVWPALADVVQQRFDWWGLDLAAALVTAVVYGLVLRRVPVR